MSFGVAVGGPWYGYAPYYYPYYYPAYYYPPVVAAPAAAPVYVEQGSPQGSQGQAQGQANWWYYCNQSQAYYPYVRECAGGWQRVSPQPPPG